MREGFCEKEAMSEGLKGKKEQTLCTWGCPASSEAQIQSLRPGAPLEGWRGKAERQKQDEEPPVDSEIARYKPVSEKAAGNSLGSGVQRKAVREIGRRGMWQREKQRRKKH